MADQTANEKAFRQSALLQWKDTRLLSVERLDSLLWFFLHMESQFSRAGIVYRGCAFRVTEDDVLLVVKAVVDGVPKVAFYTSLDTTRSICRFHRAWREDDVNWHKDKYA